MASVSKSKRRVAKSSFAALRHVSLWRSCFAGRGPKSGEQPIPALSIGVLTSAERLSRNDGSGLLARYRRSDQDGLRPDQGPRTGRPAAGPVVSPATFTENTGLAIVCPITSRVGPFPTSVVLPSSLPIAGEILTSHIRSIDTQARPIRYAGVAVPVEIAQLERVHKGVFFGGVARGGEAVALGSG